jgi:hypothetical protein
VICFLLTHVKSLLILVVLVAAFSCQEREEPQRDTQTAPWVERSGFDWSHDGQPLVTPHFVIYSDAASEVERKKLALGVELFLARLTALLNIDSTRSDWWPDTSSRFSVYLNRTHPEVPGGYAFPGGMILVSPDASFFAHVRPGAYGKLVTHELVHVITLAIGYNPVNQPPIWFREGFAEYCSGPRSSDIRTVARLDSLVGDLGHDPQKWNPLQIKTVGDYPEEIMRERYEGRYYPLFEVAVRYLVETRTPQGSPSGLLGVFERMGVGERFSTSLAATVGLSGAEFEQDFFSLTRAWLAEDSGGE